MEYLIPHYGDFKLLQLAVDSIYRTDPAAEVLIGDDTGTLDHSLFTRRSTLITPGPCQGFAANVNHLVALAKGEWITILNNDVELDRRWYSQIAAILPTSLPIDFSIASTVLRLDGSIDSLGDAISWYGIWFNRYHLHKPQPRYLKRAPILGATGGLAVLRRRVFISLGGYSTLLQSYCEDTQLNLCAITQGYRAWYYPLPRAVHRGTSTFSPSKKYYLSARNTILYIRADFSGSFRAMMLRRATAYWRLKALFSRRHRSDIRAGIKAGYATAVTPSKTTITFWPKGRYRETFWQTHLRLSRRVLASVLRRWYS